MYSDDDLVRELSEVINRTIDHPVDTRRLADAAFSFRGLDAELAHRHVRLRARTRAERGDARDRHGRAAPALRA